MVSFDRGIFLFHHSPFFPLFQNHATGGIKKAQNNPNTKTPDNNDQY